MKKLSVKIAAFASLAVVCLIGINLGLKWPVETATPVTFALIVGIFMVLAGERISLGLGTGIVGSSVATLGAAYASLLPTSGSTAALAATVAFALLASIVCLLVLALTFMSVNECIDEHFAHSRE